MYAKHRVTASRRHGVAREGEKNWRQARADGSLGAPTHDASGHTWHHPDGVLFRIAKWVARRPPARLQEQNVRNRRSTVRPGIRAVLAFIKGRGPARVRKIHARINAQSACDWDTTR